ncbi:hypothetical protein EV714DRAFT_219019 [Schizophyllum commune]
MDHLSRQFSCTSIEDFEELDRAAKARKAEKAVEAQRAAEAEAAANAVEEEVLGVGATGMQEDRSTTPKPIPGRHRRAPANAHHSAQTDAHLPPRSRRDGDDGTGFAAQDDGDATEMEDNGSDTEMEEDDRPRLTGDTNLDASAMTREERRAIAAEVLRGMLGPVHAANTNNANTNNANTNAAFVPNTDPPFVARASTSKPASKSSTKPPSTSSNKPPSSRNLIARSSTANLFPVRISKPLGGSARAKPLGGTTRAKPLGGTTRAARGVEVPREVGVPRQVDVPPEQGVPRGVEVSRGVVKASVGQARLIAAPPGVGCVPAAAVARRNAQKASAASRDASTQAQGGNAQLAQGGVPQPARPLAAVAEEASFSSTKAELGSPTFSQYRLPPPLAPSTSAQEPPMPGQAATTILRVPRFFARAPRSTAVQAPNLEQVAHPAQDLVPDQEGHPTPPLSPAVLRIWKQHMIEAFQQHMAAAVAARADELAAREEMLRCRGAQIAAAYKMSRTALEQQRAALVREAAALAARKRELAEAMARARQATLAEQQALAGRREACERQERALAQQQEALAREHRTCEEEWRQAYEQQRQAYEQQRQAYEQQLAYARQHQYHEQQRWAYPPQQPDAQQVQLVHAPQPSTSAVQLPAPAYQDSQPAYQDPQPAYAARWTAANQSAFPDQPPATNNLTLNVWAPNLNAQDLSGVFNSWSRRQ